MYRLSTYTDPIQSLIENPWWKALLASLATLAVELFSTEGRLIGIVFVMVFLDTVTGVMAASKRKEAVTSLGLRRTIVKLLEYLAVVIAAVTLGNSFESWLFWLSEFTAAYVGLTEFKSLVENVGMMDYWEKIKDRLMPSENDKNDSGSPHGGAAQPDGE